MYNHVLIKGTSLAKLIAHNWQGVGCYQTQL